MVDHPHNTGLDEPSVHALAESRLFSRAAAGDRTAIGEVWRANRRWIAAVLLAHAPRGADVDDLLQEVAATLVSKCHHIRDAASLRGWLRVVAINAARMAARGQAIERKSLRLAAAERHAAAERRDAADGPARAEPGGREEARETLALLERLPALYAEPILLQSTQGLTQRQIADLLDVPETTIETRLARGRRMLRQLVSELEHARAEAPTRRSSAT